MFCDDSYARMMALASACKVEGVYFEQMAIVAAKSGAVKTVDAGRTYLRALVENYSLYSVGIEAAQRFVLSPQVVEAALDFAASERTVQASLDYIFLPAETTWIEWRGTGAGYAKSDRHGILLMGLGEGHSALSVGVGAYMCHVTDQLVHDPIKFDLHDPTIFRRVPIPGETVTEENFNDVASAARFLVCVLALINTPRISHVIHHDIDTKLNKARLKRGKIPLMSWRDVTIRPDVGWMPKAVQEEGRTGEKRRHHVRTFMRLKQGKVEIVRPHWRGNREKGYVQHRHVVRMDGEEAGNWKGTPLPGAEIMKSGTVVKGDSDV